MKKLIVLLFFSQHLWAQNLSGWVSDGKKNPLESATVMLLAAQDSALVAFTNTDQKGKFSIEIKQKGAYILQITFIGYETFNKPIAATLEPITFGEITLKENSTLLQDLVVKGDLNPIELDKDTVTFNAKAFKINPGDRVEDLLKKMPGIEVQRDGSLKAFGENVNKVMVDGKAFFGNDTRIATKNLDADAIDKVQVFDKKSDVAEFTGIADGQDARTLNLKLKADRKVGHFGSVNIAGGTSDRFKGNLNLNRFTPNFRTSLIAMGNNVNEQDFANDDAFSFGQEGISLNNSSQSGMVKGIQKNMGIGTNITGDFGKKTNLEMSYFYKDTESQLKANSQREHFLNDAIFNTVASSHSLGTNSSNMLNLKLKTTLNAKNILRLKLEGAWKNQDMSHDFENSNFKLANQTTRAVGTNLNSGSSLLGNLNLIYMLKMKKSGRTFLADARWNTEAQKNNTDLLSTNILSMSPISKIILHQEQIMKNLGDGRDLEIHFNEPLGKRRFLSFDAGISSKIDNTKNNYYDIIEDAITPNSLLSNSFSNDYISKNGGLKFSQSTKTLEMTLAVKQEFSNIKGQLLPKNIAVNNTFKAFLPSAFFNLNLNTSQHFNGQYYTNMQEPSLYQLQPTVDNANPLSIYTGNPTLRPEYKHNIQFSYFLYDAFNFRMFNASLSAARTNHKIINALTINENLLRTYEPVNTKPENSGRARIEYSSPIKPLGIKFTANARGSATKGFGQINGVLNRTNVYAETGNFRIENRKKKVIDAMLGIRLHRSQSRFNNNENLNQSFAENTLISEATFNLTEKTHFTTTLDYQSFSQSFNDQKIHFPLWKASFSTLLDKSNKLKLSVDAFDILNRNNGISRTAATGYSELLQTNVLGRYFLVGLSYNIKGFKKKEDISVITNEEGIN